jgi:hypothetical protein
MNIHNKIAFVFNRVLLNFIKDIKDKDKDIKHKLKNNYKIFNKDSLEYIEYFNDKVPSNLFNCEDLTKDENILEFELLNDIKVKDILNNVVKDNEEDKKIFIYKLYIFNIFNYVYHMELDDDKKEVLLSTVINVINMVDNNEMDESILEEILDDDIKKMLKKVFDNKTKTENEKSPLMEGFDMDMLNNSKIGEIAKEISESIDINSLNIDKPEELMNNMFSGSNNVLGDIISKVGTTITTKIANGEINQETLMNEAFDMMGKMNMGGNNNFMNEMMKNMGGAEMGDMMKAMNNMNNPTKRRLQRKLEQKK